MAKIILTELVNDADPAGRSLGGRRFRDIGGVLEVGELPSRGDRLKLDVQGTTPTVMVEAVQDQGELGDPACDFLVIVRRVE